METCRLRQVFLCAVFSVNLPNCLPLTLFLSKLIEMKKGVLLLVVFVCTLTTFAQRVDADEAMQVAIQFWKSHGFSATSDLKDVVSATPVKYNDEVVYYQIDMAPQGWILVSATKAAVPVLAYAPTGTFAADDLPENCEAWMGQYQQKLNEIIDKQLISTPEIDGQWEEVLNGNGLVKTRGVEPFLTSLWDQGRYYNDMCPADPAGPGGHCYAGCVPTAMGQICNYFRWPNTGVGSYAYDDPDYGTLSADFENTTYRWDEMATSLNGRNLAVAELLFHLGVSCDLVYGPDGSGMYNHKAAYALRTFFKYDPATQYVYRDSTSMDWDSLLVSHLDRRIPMYYAGWSVPNINGHAFVVDGYQDDNYYHFNWGWSGSANGYYYTNALNPSGSNFNLAQELIVNAVPDSALYDYPSGCSGYSELTTTGGTIDDGSGPLYDYQPETDCSWLIKPTDSVSSITLSFLEFGLAVADTLFVYKGTSAEAPLLAALSGDLLPDDMEVDGDEVFVHFVSQSPTGSKGWLMSFVSEIPVYCSSNGMLTDISGAFSDGSGPRDYHNASACMWMIAPPGAQTIELQFNSFDTEPQFDLVEVYDSNTLLGEFSGSELPPTLTATSGYMFVVFTTNFDITAPGWSATYTTDLVSLPETGRKDQALTVFPNPAHQQLTMLTTLESGSHVFELLDCSGRVVAHHNSEQSQVTFNVEALPVGMYFARLQYDGGVEMMKVMIQ